MTPIMILGLLAAFHLAALLHRLAVLALPVCVGLIVASLAREEGCRLLDATTAGLLAASLACIAGRTLTMRVFPLLVRLPVRLIFSGAAGCAGFQAGLALAELAAFEMISQRCVATWFAMITAAASWRDMAPQARAQGVPPRTD